MKTKIAAAALFALTAATIITYPALNAKVKTPDPVTPINGIPHSAATIDVVFVLDTTGSMGGLIQTAKEKIWSIATTMTSAQQQPDIRIGLVAYRDRGDDYVTQVTDLSSDLDTVYASLMDLQAGGGGDGPESVNAALFDAVQNVSWSQNKNTYQAIFLVGDAPPHMDYQDEMQYPEILQLARQKGIVVNTIHCGDLHQTATSWQQIASAGNGEYFQVEQSGGAVAVATPYDKKIAALSAELDKTRLFYGSRKDKKRMQRKVAAAEKFREEASVAARARRGTFNSSASGKKNLLGDNELVAAVSSGAVDLDALEKEMLPESLKALKPQERREEVQRLADRRDSLEQQIQNLARERKSYIGKKVEESGTAEDTLDHQIYKAVESQASAVGLDYSDGPDY